jgi:hypothetical protein
MIWGSWQQSIDFRSLILFGSSNDMVLGAIAQVARH